MNVKDPSLAQASRSAPEQLNRNCICTTLDRAALRSALNHEAGDAGFYEAFNHSRPHLFSNVPVFLSKSVIEEMRGVVDAIEAATKLPTYREAVFSWAPKSRSGILVQRALMGYGEKAVLRHRSPMLREYLSANAIWAIPSVSN